MFFFQDFSRCSIRWTKMCELVTGLVRIKFVSILTCFYSISIQHMTVCSYVNVSNCVWIPFKIVEMKMEIALFTCETWAANVIKWKKNRVVCKWDRIREKGHMLVSIELDLWGNHMMQKRRTKREEKKLANVKMSSKWNRVVCEVKNKLRKRAPWLSQHTYLTIYLHGVRFISFYLWWKGVFKRLRKFDNTA